MPAAIDGDGDQFAFASLREPAWHGLGTVFSEPVGTSDMLDLAHLSGWDVRLADLTVEHDAARWVTPAFGVVRTNPFDGQTDVLGIVGDRYTIVQNEDAFTFADNIGDGARWETAGAISGGRKVFGSLSIDREVVLDPSGADDRISNYLLISTSHDGSLSVQASITPVRVVCQNTLNIALRAASQTFKVRHTQSVEGRVAEARKALGLTHAYLDAFEAEAQAMIEAQVTADAFRKIVETVYPMPDPDAKAPTTRWNNRVDRLMTVWSGPTQENIAGTAWAAFNALTEADQWGRSVRGGNTENYFAAGAGFDPVTNAFRSKAREVVLAAIK